MMDGKESAGRRRIDIHVHWDREQFAYLAGLRHGQSHLAQAPGNGKSGSAPVLKMMAAGVLVIGAMALSYRAGSSPRSSVPAYSVPAAGQDQGAAGPGLPPELARALSSPPRVTPPPGGPRAPEEPAGPALFGLHD